MMQLAGRRYDTGEPIRVTIDGERIAAVEPAWPDGNAADWPIIAPGLFDLQINGHRGRWFSDAGLTADHVITMLKPHFAFGITRLCPTLVTASFDALAAGFAAIDEACRRETWVERLVPGCHLEGPYISLQDGPRGAHPRGHVRPADFDEFARLQEIAGGRIRLVTLAPEVDGALEFIGRAVERHVVVAIGHTAASAEQIRAAVQAGARLSTHLGNGAHPLLPRHPNYIWEQLGDQRLWASIITDGHHLPASVIRSILKTKGSMRTILTCDAAGLAGCPPGRYDDGDVAVEILNDGRIVVADQRELLAGSSLATDTCVANAVRLGGVTLAEAIDMASRNPARLLGFEEIRLQRGSRADLLLLHFDEADTRLRVVATISAGELRCGTPPAL